MPDNVRNLDADFELKAVDPAGVFEGYASVFEAVDQGRDAIARGAFKRSLKDRGPRQIKLLWQHDPTEPIGVLEEVREDARGLYVKGRLLMDVRRAREAHALMRAGALDGLSIGFQSVTSRLDDLTGVRTLDDVDLWEISLVTFPMQEMARISAFKRQPIPTIRAFETFLREAGGFSRSEAKTIARHGFQNRSSQRDADVGEEYASVAWDDVMAAIGRAHNLLTVSQKD